MVTTIQVEEETLELLKKLKEHFNVSTYNEAIERMAERGLRRRSMQGYLGRRNRADILRGLRDKHERL
ncbi:hypothetical protein HY640_03615 [Candidatus Woesearchaeota archaeon]|nr:hypothetical protein [Candidatus Woesearchaeota archaeon]